MHIKDFPIAKLGPVIGPCFSQTETEFPFFYYKFLNLSDFILHFGENFMKFAQIITILQLTIFSFVVQFDE